jgi:hypothetical protein
MNLEKIGPSTHCRGFSGHSMSDSAQVTCDQQHDRGYEHQTRQTEKENMLAHVGAYSAYASPAV